MDYCIWDELNKTINWSRVDSKSTFINELNRAVKKIRYDVVWDSVEDWCKRMYRILQNDGSFLH